MSTTRKTGEAVLQVYGQYAHHDDVYVVGTHAALARLRSAIDQALLAGIGRTEAMVSDGEGYGIVVVRHQGEAHASAWQQLRLPYTADWIAVGETERGKQDPRTLLSRQGPAAS
ncbi:MAG: hypothetical protein AB1411_15725 [Nitrospirota bacterium]